MNVEKRDRGLLRIDVDECKGCGLCVEACPPKVIGMSALLTTTMREQTRVIEALKTAGLRDKYKVIVGGGACTQQWADKIGADAYAEDANDGVRKINELMGN